MRQVAIVSGKGGTGKTSVTASLARLAGRAVAADCDVDAANLWVFLGGELVSREPFEGGDRALVDPSRCVECWACEDVCRFGAVRMAGGQALVDPTRCHGCHACALVCPAEAIGFVPNVVGEVLVSRTAVGPLVHAALEPGQESSGKLATEVRRRAAALAEAEGIDLVLVDGPPGVGCPVHASLTGVDLAVAVVEPTLSAAHDLERLAGLVARFRVPLVVAVNKHDLSAEGSAGIDRLAERLGLAVVARLPFDRRVPAAAARGEPLLAVEGFEAPLADLLRVVESPALTERRSSVV